MEQIALTAEVTDTGWTDLIEDAKVETLDESFRRNRERLGTLPLSAENHLDHLSTFNRATASGRVRPSMSLSLGQIFAAWVRASLDALEDEYRERLTGLLDAYRYDDPEGSTMTHEEFCAALASLDISIGIRRTNVTKKAYGITYAEFIA